MTQAPFDPDQLIRELPRFDWAGPGRTSALERAYRSYYGIDCSDLGVAVQQLGTLEVAGYRLALHYWAPARPRGTLFLLHGYYDHQGLYRHLIRFFLQQNLAVVGFDLPGHGLSTGARAVIGDFAEYQTALEGVLAFCAHLPRPWYGFGQSTGGAIWIDYLTRTGGTGFAQVFLFAPLVRPVKWRIGRLSYYLARPFVRHVVRHFSENTQDPSFREFLELHDPLQPRLLPVTWVGALNRWIARIERRAPVAFRPLIVQGQQDHTVDWQHNLPVLERLFQQPDIHLLPDARHHLANEIESIRATYLDWLSSALNTSAPDAATVPPEAESGTQA